MNNLNKIKLKINFIINNFNKISECSNDLNKAILVALNFKEK